MNIIYRAKDGREFDEQYECELYEAMLTVLENPFTSVFKDSQRNVISLFDEVGNIRDDIIYMTVASDEEARRIYELCSDRGANTPWDDNVRWHGKDACKAGRYFWDSNTEEWVNFAEFVEHFNFIHSAFEEG